jgi:transcriptional regulator
LKAIVGVELVVSRVEGKANMSQNQPERNRMGVVAGLRE